MDKKKHILKKCAQDRYVRSYTNNMAPRSQRQMPLFSQVGKGLRGDSMFIDIDYSSGEPDFTGMRVNEMTGTTEEIWRYPMSNFVPHVDYRVYEGVREIDEQLRLGFYINFVCSAELEEGVTHIFWSFDTPFIPTENYYGEVYQADHVIDESPDYPAIDNNESE